jgi:hypothetical protein
MVQTQYFVVSMPAQVTKGCNVIVADQEPHGLLQVLGFGLKPSVCHDEPVGIGHARLNRYLTIEEY